MKKPNASSRKSLRVRVTKRVLRVLEELDKTLPTRYLPVHSTELTSSRKVGYTCSEIWSKIYLPWCGTHSFLNEHIRANRCKRIMEIGVWNGDNAKTMIEVAIQNFPPEEVEYYGFDFFDEDRFHQVEQKLEKTGCKFKLFKGDTLETLPKAAQTLPKMDLIFIDGGKSLTEAESDWINSKTLMHDATAVFVHNYEFSGVQRMINDIPQDYQVTIIHPPAEGETALIKKKIDD